MNSVVRAILRPFSVEGGELEIPSVGVAESQARAHDGSASYYDGIARADLANEARKTAAWWRGLAALPDEAADRLHRDLLLKGTEAIDALLALAEKADKPLFELVSLATHILAGLLELAAPGRKEAARALVDSIGETVNNFEVLATRKPELFREWARGCIAIPGLISRKTAQTQDNKRLLESLEQGEDCPLAILPTGKRGKSWSFKGATLIAFRLVAHIRISNHAYESDKFMAGEEFPELPGWRHEAAKLDPFSKQSAGKWAEVGWQVLAEVSPNNQPERHPVLKTLFKVRHCRIDYTGRTGAQLNGASVKRESPSIAKHDMKEKLRDAFQLIALDKPLPKKPPRKEKRKK